jgi:hypothetical protein
MLEDRGVRLLTTDGQPEVERCKSDLSRRHVEQFANEPRDNLQTETPPRTWLT